jgi:hypothetical protein
MIPLHYGILEEPYKKKFQFEFGKALLSVTSIGVIISIFITIGFKLTTHRDSHLQSDQNVKQLDAK